MHFPTPGLLKIFTPQGVVCKTSFHDDFFTEANTTFYVEVALGPAVMVGGKHQGEHWCLAVCTGPFAEEEIMKSRGSTHKFNRNKGLPFNVADSPEWKEQESAAEMCPRRGGWEPGTPALPQPPYPHHLGCA